MFKISNQKERPRRESRVQDGQAHLSVVKVLVEVLYVLPGPKLFGVLSMELGL